MVVDKVEEIEAYVRKLDADKSQGIRKMIAKAYLRGVQHGLSNAPISKILEQVNKFND